MDQSKSYHEWYVVFTRAKGDFWIHRFIDKEMGHVYCVRREGDHWLRLNPQVNGLKVDIIPHQLYPHIRCLTHPNDKIIKVKSCYNAVIFGAPGFNTCVEAVKGILGIRDIFCLTIKQLHRNLLGDKYG